MSPGDKRDASRTIGADFLMLITAAVWGTAFVAQRAGMEHVGPYTFNAVRFALGALSLVPFLFVPADSAAQPGAPVASASSSPHKRTASRWTPALLISGLAAGTVLFLGSSFQQVGIVYTTAGNAGFITGLYVIIVPITGLFFGQRPGTGVWFGAVLAVAGLYFINDAPGFRLAKGDLLVLVCAFFFAAHVLIIGRLSPRNPAVPLSIVQFLTCSALSLVTAMWRESLILQDLIAAAVPILYGGVGSVGIAYTLQVIGQKDAPPAHAAIILSLESVFALAGGFLILGEAVPGVKLVGCALMLAGMLSAQLQRYVLGGRR
jgi:drug/metabolite transporter (DMT)-like permease